MQNPNINRFKYCPSCGEEALSGQSVKSFICGNCGFSFYMNTAASTTALIFDSQMRLLIVIRKHEPVKGTWDLPGGFVEPFETGEDAVKREVMEELNLKVTETSCIGTYPNTYLYAGITYTTLDLVFTCKVDTFKSLKAADDAADYFFCELSKIDPDKFGLESMKKIAAEILNNKLLYPGTI